MHLLTLEVRNLRILEHVDLSLAPGLNVFVGANGSGKTSVLESIHYLGTGRSFRSRRLQHVCRWQTESLLVRSILRGEVGGGGEGRGEGIPPGTTLALEHGPDGLQIRYAGESLATASELARLLPVVLVSPDTVRMLTDGADLRRRLLDWVVFHVEPAYHGVHQQFRRVLRQRNAALRGADSAELATWSRTLADIGGRVHEMRLACMGKALPIFEAVIRGLLSIEVGLEYRQGWEPRQDLHDLLLAVQEADRHRGFSGPGPQRADLTMTVEGRSAHQVLSRGELKLLALGLQLAQAAYLARVIDRIPVVLVDELASELDEASRERVFTALAGIGAQTMITAVSRELVENGVWQPDQVFHVERGVLSEMV